MRSRAFRLTVVLALVWAVVPAVEAAQAPHAQAVLSSPQKANTDLARRWTPQKIGKIVFDTGVNARWMETPDKFWYSYETSKGRSFYIVDPALKSKTPIFDNAKMAALLTKTVLIPYDAQHLPIQNLKFVDKDTAVVFDLEVQKDSDIRVDDKFMKAGDFTKARDEKKAAEKKEAEKKDEEKKKEEEKKEGEKKEPPAKEPESKTTKLYFRYELASQKLSLLPDYLPPDPRPRWASVSPDEKIVLFARGHNLYMMDAENFKLAQKKADDKAIKEVQLTTDGEEHYGYTRDLNDEDKKTFQKDEKDRKDYRVPAIGIVWSRDSKKFSCVRQDERKVGDLWVINALSNPRPTLETYRYAMPGEENQPQPELLVFDIGAKSKVKVKAEAFKDQTLSVYTATRKSADLLKDYPPPAQWISETADKIYFGRQSRDLHKFDVCLADTATGEVKVLVEERLNTYVDVQPIRLVNGGKEIIWWSERDGWGHFYLYNGEGKLVRQLTSGEFTCQGIEGVDEKLRVLYFAACGREPKEDPYFMHLYRVNLDGTGFKLLNAGDFNHGAAMGDSAKFFVDTYSRVDTAPKSELRDANGNLLLSLEETDVTALVEAGYKFPEPFKVKADDGITDLYGVMYKPFDFDAQKKYPLIAYVYPGPQTESVSKTFVPRSFSQWLAQFGFVVIEIGNRGGHPSRSKWYHNYGYGNLRDYGLADKKRSIEQLALKYPYIDIDRVGIFGHSGGGFMTAAALLVYPDFFKVGVSSSGNHENNIYNRWWSEKHHGVKEIEDDKGNVKFEYSIAKNSEVAKNLKGHLLLATGDIDNNVHPGNTIRLANALIKANKRFDFILFPGQRHGYGDMGDYWNWIRADYFSRWLLGDFSQTVDMVELNREQEQSGRPAAATTGGGQGQRGIRR